MLKALWCVLCLAIIGFNGGEARAQKLEPLFELRLKFITQISFAPRGDAAAVTFLDSRVGWLSMIMRTANREALLQLLGQKDTIRVVVFAPDGRTFGWAVGPRLVLSSLDEKPGQKGRGAQFSTSAMAFSPDGKLLAAASNAVKDKQILIRLFDAQTLQARGDLMAPLLPFKGPGDDAPPRAVAFSPDGKRVFAISSSVKWEWDVATHTQNRDAAHYLTGPGVALSPNGEIVACLLSDPNRSSKSSSFSWRLLVLQRGNFSIGLTTENGSGFYKERFSQPAFSMDSRIVAAPFYRDTGAARQNGLAFWAIDATRGRAFLSRPTQHEHHAVFFGPTIGNQRLLATIYENPLDKTSRAVFWRLTTAN